MSPSFSNGDLDDVLIFTCCGEVLHFSNAEGNYKEAKLSQHPTNPMMEYLRRERGQSYELTVLHHPAITRSACQQQLSPQFSMLLSIDLVAQQVSLHGSRSIELGRRMDILLAGDASIHPFVGFDSYCHQGD
jgi:hypothetical protein